MNESIWCEGVKIPSFPKLNTDTSTDVLIIGGGMAGLLCAHQLDQAGMDYILVEADRIMAGVSRNTTAKITSQHGLIYHRLLKKYGPEKALLYRKANEEAGNRFRNLAQTIDCDYEVRTNYIFSGNDPEILDAELNALRQLGIPAFYERNLPLPFPVAGAIGFDRQAQFHPLKFAAAIAKDLRIYEHTAVKSFEGSLAFTDTAKIHANKIIVATHFPICNKHGMYFLKQYQHRSYVLALENAPCYPGMYLEEGKNGLSFRNYGNLLLLGGGGHRTGKKGGCWDELETFSRKYFPDAHEVMRWATQDCMTLDGVPYIGQYSSNTPNLYVATGFNKWGMTGSMVSAMVLTDLIYGKENPYKELFSPARSMMHPQLLVNAAESTLHLLTPTKPRCPHLGCALKWNPAEHSWDCPCHGSRFTEGGKLLNNPANGNLK